MTAQIQLFGRFYVAPNALALPTLTRPRQQAFLAYLLLECHKPQARQTIAATFWPESSEAQASKNLRVLLVELRQVWPAFDQTVQIERTTLQWRPQHPVTVDVVEFANLLAQAKRAAQQQASEQHLSALRHATALYSGDLLPHLFDEWVEQARRRLAEQFKTALAELAQLHQARGCFADAIQSAQRLQQVDPLSEQACRLLLTCYPLLGEKALALQAYQSYENALHHELGIEPEADLQASYLELLRAQSVLQQASHRYLSPKAEPAPTLVGRANEWTQLTTLWRTAHPGVPRFVLLTGEAGIGKTQLAAQFLHWVQGQGAVVAAAKCYAFGGSSGEEALSYAPIVTWLRSSELARHLSRLNERWLRELLRILPEIHSTHPTLPLPEAMRHGLQRSQFFEALTHAMCASGRPLLLFIDDLQWCDRETLDWLLYLLLQFPLTTPLLIIGALRSGEVTEQHPYHPWRAQLRYHQRWAEVKLTRLNASDTALLAQQIMSADVRADFGALLHQHTEGNPLFIVETLRTLLVNATPDPTIDWTAHLRQALTDGTLPPKMQTVIEQRIATLSSQAQQIIEMGAVLGHAFTFSVLAQINKNERELVAALDELLQRQIVREQDTDSYDFSHDRLREVVYGRLSRQRRRLLHRQVAMALETIHAEDLDTVSAQLALHYEHAGQLSQAVAYYDRAAQMAQRLSANEEAVGHLRRSLTLMKMSEVNPMQNYRVEFTDDAKRYLSQRRAASHAAFFTPHLKPGMSLLDCGCGPGSITADLAEIVAPAEVIGIDHDPAQLALAHRHAEVRGIDNVRFEQADLLQLPFPDQSFDAVFVHAVIEYLPNPIEAYAEIRRVLKPGGVMGSRHSDWGDLLFVPATELTDRFFELFRHYMRHCGGEPEFGRHQFAAMRKAGFTQMRVSASCDCWTPNVEGTRFVANFLANYSLSAEFAEPLVRLNLASADELQTVSDAMRQWGADPDAFMAEPWGEAVAWRT